MRLPRLNKLHVNYDQLKCVTNNFTNAAAHAKCAKLKHITFDTTETTLIWFYQNLSIINLFFSIFKQIKILKSITENCYVPSDFSLKFVQRFPSLTDIELQLYSFDDCIYAIDILVSHLKNLSYLKIYYIEVSSLDHPFSLNYITNKRHQAFGFNIIDEHKITISRNKESVEIRLS
ncbi:unnamed protein product [Rotaria sp. Silwood2]|nr:unnamed protein product [Rotaria sp. Silwood2]CAF4614898.1 unnamed protein product [Rotaria sp. Silwood2]